MTATRSRRSPAGNPKLAVGYLRVSTDTDRQALGAEAQRVAIDAWSVREGITLMASFVEQVTGSAPLHKRLVLLEALASVAVHGAGFLVVHRLDRFSRSPVTAALAEAELQRHGATLAVADGAGSGDDPTAQLVRGILLSVAQFEKSMIRARIIAALAVKKSRGELTGVAPYGFRRSNDGRSLEPHPEEARVLAEIRAIRAEGLSMRATLAEATSRGLRSRVDKPFTLASLHAMVRTSRPNT